MAVYDRFLIAPFEEGQETRNKPFLLPEKAFEKLRNMYVWRQTLRKRFGATVMDTTQTSADQQRFTRLRTNLVTLGASPQTVNVGTLVTQIKIGQMFSVGTSLLTVYQVGAGVATYTTGGGVTATVDSTATPNTITVTGGAGVDLFYYPANPVMHFGTYEQTNINDEITFAFDGQYAYVYTAGTGWDRSATGTSTWTVGASKDDYFWTTNYRGVNADDFYMYVTNNVAADAMRFWTGATWSAFGSAGTTLTNVGSGSFIVTSKIILPFDKRLLMFNVTEDDGAATNETFINRIRYSAIDVNPSSATAWLVSSTGGFLDLPKNEAIQSVSKVKDVLIIKCERSHFRLSATGNALAPFIVQEIDDSLGVESVNSSVDFDKNTLGFGAHGINACDGQTVQRIDEKIPENIFDISNSSSGYRRVDGIRDFFSEMAYWAYPSVEEQTTYNLIWPNRVLVYDYLQKTWAYNDDSISALGYFWRQQAQSSRQIAFKTVIGGNQQGWTFLVDIDVTRNSSSLQITDVTAVGAVVTVTAIDHNLTNGSYVYFNNIQSLNSVFSAAMNDMIFAVTTTTTGAFTITLSAAPAADTYEGLGTLERVSEPDVLTKAFNFYMPQINSLAFNKVNFYVDSTTAGEFSVDFIPSASSVSLLTDATSSGAILGNNVLDTAPFTTVIPLEAFQDRFWHSVQFNATGETVQLRIFLTAAQYTAVRRVSMVDYWRPFQDIKINAMALFVTKLQELA